MEYIETIISDSPIKHGFQENAWTVLLTTHAARRDLNIEVSKNTLLRAFTDGFVRKKHRYLSKKCSRTFVIGDARRKESLKVKKARAIIFYSLGKASFGFLAKLFGVSRSLTYRWVKEGAESLPEPAISNEIKEIKFDEMWHFIQSKKIWIIKALDRSRGRTIAWVIGNRDTSTFTRLYKKFEQLNDGVFYTDDWEAFKKVLPPERHIIGTRGTVIIERDNNKTRHHLERITRRTKVVSKKEQMVHA